MKFCKDCRYIDADGASCNHPSVGVSPVTGEPRRGQAELLRSAMGNCGPDGRLFLPREVAMPAAPNG